MAPVKLKNVVSFSSQDTDHCAKNLLETNQWRRWLCAPGDRSGSVQAEFQMERAVRIGFIDIGNYGSALIEILVRRSSSSDDQFKTLVPTTSCITPMDSKQGKNKTGVKMFSRDQLCEDARDEYWDRIKVVCRQPFKKDSQFGLAFIKISSIEEKENSSQDRQPHDMHTEIKKPVPKPKPVQKQQERVSILSPSWKSNAAFQKKVDAINPGESSATLDLKDRLVRIESTSESKSQSGHSLGRAAQIILAASGKRAPSLTSQTSINKENSSTSSSGATTPTVSLSTPQPPPSSSSSLSSIGTKRGKGKNKTSVLEQPPDDVVLLLEEQVKEFLSHVGPALKDATLTELRPKFESCLGRKLVKNEKAIFKRLAIHAVEALDDPAGTDLPDIGLRRTSKKESGWLQAKPNPSIPNVGPCAKDTNLLNTRWSQANTSPNISIPGPTRNSKNNGYLQSLPPYVSSSPPSRDNDRIPYSGIKPKETGVKGRDLPSWMNSPAQSGDGKPCPKCGGLFPASRMNVHIWNCKGKRESAPVKSSQSPASHMKRRANSLIHEHHDDSSSKRQIGSGIVGGGVTMATDNAAESGVNNGGEDMWTPRRGGRGSQHGSTARTGRGRGRKNNGQTNATSTPGRGRGQGKGKGRGRGGAKSSTKKGKKATSVEYVDPLSSSDNEIDHVTPSTSGRGRGQRGRRGQPRGRGRGGGQRRSPVNGLPNPWTNSPGSSDITDDDMDTSYHDPQPEMLLDLVPCPLCNQEFPQCTIETHAAFCGESGGGMHGGGHGGLGLGGFGALSGGFLRDVEAAIWVD